MLSVTQLATIDRKTWNGHTHTAFCPHGSGEDTRAFIEAAIEAGFKTYSITEHFSMPPDFYRSFHGSRHAIYTAAMSSRELDAYLKKMTELKAAFKDRIRILIGFEIDYISKYRDWTDEMLAKYGPQIDDAILSVHFLPTSSGLRAVDDSFLDFQSGVLKEYGSPSEVAAAYLETVNRAVKWQSSFKPARYGHLMLYRKWRNLFPATTQWQTSQTTALMNEVLRTIAHRHELLDCNMAGLFRNSETETSPNFTWLAVAQKLGIPLVYGPDAHSVAAVTQGYNTYLENHYFQ